jgi:hypothetical protein
LHLSTADWDLEFGMAAQNPKYYPKNKIRNSSEYCLLNTLGDKNELSLEVAQHFISLSISTTYQYDGSLRY